MLPWLVLFSIGIGAFFWSTDDNLFDSSIPKDLRQYVRPLLGLVVAISVMGILYAIWVSFRS